LALALRPATFALLAELFFFACVPFVLAFRAAADFRDFEVPGFGSTFPGEAARNNSDARFAALPRLEPIALANSESGLSFDFGPFPIDVSILAWT
jgi:hypothetical protein